MTDKKQANMGKIFPEISAKTLENKPETLPADAKGKVTLVGVALPFAGESAAAGFLAESFL